MQTDPLKCRAPRPAVDCEAAPPKGASTPQRVHPTERLGAPSLTFPLLLCLVAVHFFRIGCQLVITAWSAVGITGRPQSVGQILLISSATTLIASPFIGSLVDRSARKKPLVLAGHFGVALSGASPFVLAMSAPQSAPFVALIVATIMSSVAGISIGCAMDYYVKLSLPGRSRTAKLALMNTVSQCTLIAGTAFGGYLVSFAPWQDAFLLIGGCGLALTALAAYRLPALIHTLHAPRDTARAGPALYLKHPYLFSVAFCSALAFAVGQATNTLLPAFMNLDLKLSSEHYASVEAAWSIGALVASAGLARFAKDRFGPLGHDLVIVLVIAAVLSIVPRLSTPGALIAVHFILGVGFAATRVRADARFLSACPTHLLGRFRANSLCLTSLVSAAVFVTPTLSNGLAAPSLYQWLSAGIATSALILMWTTRRPETSAG